MPSYSAPHSQPASLRLTTHASVRLQQRGIPPWYLRLLVEYGKPLHDGHGAVLLTVDKRTRRRLQMELSRPEYARAERYFGVYAVVNSYDDAVITAAHRTRRNHAH